MLHAATPATGPPAPAAPHSSCRPANPRSPVHVADKQGLARIPGLIEEAEARLGQLERCTWGIAQVRAYLARPGGSNVTLGAIRLAELRARRDALRLRLGQIDLELRELTIIP